MGNCWTSSAAAEQLSDLRLKSPRNSIAVISEYRSDAAKCKKCYNMNEAEDTSSTVSTISQSPERPYLQQSCLKEFSFHELKCATADFHNDNLLGQGGFGPVFMGWLDEQTLMPAEPTSGIVVAVKMLKEESYQGHGEWETEVKYLGHLNHENLVKLIGFCSEGNQRMLVYEYMPKGSLDDHLFSDDPNFQPLPWNLRMKVALGAAKGLAYLHRPDIKVIHRDFKSSNILLDTGFNPKLSDFGLVIDGPPPDKTHLSLSKVFGTYGYVDPIYLASGHLTTKSDVYGFGVVLLEIMSGRRAIDSSRPPEERDLVRWALPYFNNKWCLLNIVMDKRIEGQYVQKEAVRVAQIAGFCLAEDPKLRPSVNEVVFALELSQGEHRAK